jgi:hypothetical protein
MKIGVDVKASATITLKQLALSALVAVTGDTTIKFDFPLIAAEQISEQVGLLKRRPTPADRNLVQLAKAFHFEDFELIVLSLLQAIETDPSACRLVGTAQAPLAGARPLLGFLAMVFNMFGPVEHLMTVLSSGKAVQSGSIVIGAEEAPLPERSLRIAAPILDAFGQSLTAPLGLRFLPTTSHPVPQAIKDTAKTYSMRLVENANSGVIIRANSETEALAVSVLLAHYLQQRAALVLQEAPLILAAWLLASQTIPVFYAYKKPGECLTIPDLAPYVGPWICVTDLNGIVEVNDALAMNWIIPTNSELTRISLWQAQGIANETARQAAKNYRISSARIAKLANAARVSSGGAIDHVELQHIAQTVNLQAPSNIAGLARKIEGHINNDAFVQPKLIVEHLQLLLGRCRMREGLANTLGPASAARYHAGVRALFHGASGTGKSLAAQWLASVLGLPIYRVDLASVTSKWIGETEKNIGQLLSAAEEQDVILLFDEADSLFSSRTDVGNANDRHANSQTNYLLQRLESHEGIVILTSNARDRLDGAFTRRLDAIIEFPMPELEARRDIWRAHLAKNGLSDDEFNHLAAVIDLAGGHVRNLVLSAAVLAAGKAPALPHLIAAAKIEYQKLGRQVPRELELL